jgi:hypothetical protein
MIPLAIPLRDFLDPALLTLETAEQAQRLIEALERPGNFDVHCFA